MSVRDDIRAGVRDALGAVGGGSERGLQYRLRTNPLTARPATWSAWAAIVGVLSERGSAQEYDEKRQAQVLAQAATLQTSDEQPALAPGSEVQDGASVWSVLEMTAAAHGLRTYTLERRTVLRGAGQERQA